MKNKHKGLLNKRPSISELVVKDWHFRPFYLSFAFHGLSYMMAGLELGLKCLLTSLPPEILVTIVSYLPPQDLVKVNHEHFFPL